jgi:hypothetical protein
VTKLTATSAFDLCGAIPRSVNKTLTAPVAALVPLAPKSYFILLKSGASLSADVRDAKELGQLLVHELEPFRTGRLSSSLGAKLETLLHRSAGLRELSDEHPWVATLLLHVLRNRVARPRVEIKVDEQEKGAARKRQGGSSKILQRITNSLGGGSLAKLTLENFKERHAAIAGCSMARIMLATTAPDAAVDEVRAKEPKRALLLHSPP